MKGYEYFIHLIISVIVIIGVYQFYFFAQRNVLAKVRIFNSTIDEKMPYWPIWSWIYSFLYYPAILYINWTITSSHQFIIIIFSFVILLVMQMFFFLLFPVATPAHWRTINKGANWSERFLLYVQKFDDSSNCFPSMHVSVATLTALLIYLSIGSLWIFLFPILIAISCVFTKQHYLIDLPAGAVVGWAAFQCYLVMI